MPRRLKTVIVDDDEFIVSMVKDLCQDSVLVKVIATYMDPRQFLKEAPMLDFDLVLLDVHMPQLDGTVLAQMLNNKPVIFITGTENRLKDALSLSPIDVVVKPFSKDRLNKALEKAVQLIGGTKEYDLFNVAESNRKMKIKLADMVLITSDEEDPRNKQLLMQGGQKYTLMDYNLETLMEMCPSLIQVNKAQLVSMDAFSEVDHDIIVLKGIEDYNMEITLSRSYRQQFMAQVFYRK